MDAKSWGRVFREIREMKNLSLAKVAGDYENSPNFITSKQQVSRFELGISDITLTKIYDLVENMGLSFEEYLYHVRNYELPSGRALFEALGRLQELGNLPEIEKIYQELEGRFAETQKQTDYWNALEYKSFLAQKNYKSYQISEKEIQEVSDDLFSMLEWGEAELFLFSEFIYFLPETLVFEFSKELIKRTKFYRKIPENKTQVTLVIRDCTNYFIEKSQVEQAEILLKSYEKLIESPIIDVYNRKEYLSIKGNYQFLIGDIEKGNQIFEDLAIMYEKLGYDKAASYMKEKRHK
ncbi:helix-turn-helix domain-containing protein [Lactococcus hircilactis]|uniref:Helix-turn-helix domain-containing protein n=1 Tax=Lactococcus hircilactis TaxID=1494462 RepID=A0A7X1Z891_9LACT|nr:Rgg/GadR/MutR family transcriptional regulator [Lactococcus hircilactis]MQW39658.1 helix-turn-helix domain-containing protein [Lactococcus hircilactis]